jgi:amino-acid N-acetyltransferase
VNKLKFTFATTRDEIELKQFLKANDLLYQDIRPLGLKHFLLARDGADVVGMVGLEIQADSALLRSLAVKQGYRGKGLATLLVEKIEAYARNLNIDSLYLLTVTAEEFFKKRNFQPAIRQTAPAGIQRTAEFKDLCPASAVFMVKDIASG